MPPRPDPSAVRMILVDRTVRCDECGFAMPPGTVMVATCIEPCEPARVVHDGRCPAAWTPTVIDGDATVLTEQLALPLLAVVPAETTTPTGKQRRHR